MPERRTVGESLDSLRGIQQRGFTFVEPGAADGFISFGALRAEAARRAALLRARGLKAGRRMAIGFVVTPLLTSCRVTFLPTVGWWARAWMAPARRVARAASTTSAAETGGEPS